MNPTDRPEYVRIKFTDIPKEFFDEYNLTNHIHNGWVYFVIVKDAMGFLKVENSQMTSCAPASTKSVTMKQQPTHNS